MRRSPRAFTLIELLVVISIIALLIAILLPALQGARDAARLVACNSQVRQITIAMNVHAGDQKGELPYGLWYGGGSGFFRVWDDYLHEYLAGGLSPAEIDAGLTSDAQALDILICPSDPTTAGFGTGRSYVVPLGGWKQPANANPQRVDTSRYTAPYFTRKQNQFGGFPVVFSGAFERSQNGDEPIRFSLDDIPQPAEVLGLIEKPQGGQGNNNVQGNNSGQDGAERPSDQFYNSGLGVLYAGGLGLYHGGDDGGADPLDANPISNYGFLDGHSATLRASDTLRPGTAWNSIAPDYMWTRNPDD